MGLVRVVAAEKGVRSVRLRKVITRSGTSGADILGGDLGCVGYNVKTIEGVHVSFLPQVTGKKAIRQKDGSCRRAASNRVLQEAGTQLFQTYIDPR